MLNYLILFGILIIYFLLAYYHMAFLIMANSGVIDKVNSMIELAFKSFFEMIYVPQLFLFAVSILFFLPAYFVFDLLNLIF
jgi:hypothetical protein